MEFFDIHIVSIVSSVSARKLKCPSSARLGSEPSQLGLAWAGKFQLELISSIYDITKNHNFFLCLYSPQYLDFFLILFNVVIILSTLMTQRIYIHRPIYGIAKNHNFFFVPTAHNMYLVFFLILFIMLLLSFPPSFV